MNPTQYTHLAGKVTSFETTDAIIGNCSHIYQSILLVVASGTLEGTFQQMMVPNSLGNLEALSADVQVNANGQVEMLYPSEKIIHRLEAGSIVEVRPGCAYALNPLSKGQLVEYIIPTSQSTKLFGNTIGSVTDSPLDDTVHFELASKLSTPILPITNEIADCTTISELGAGAELASDLTPEIPLSETETAASHIETAVINTPSAFHSNENIISQQKVFYREASATMIKICKLLFIPLILAVYVGNINYLPLNFALFVFIVYCFYKLAIECIYLYKNKSSLSIEPNGLVINNDTYMDLALDWCDIYSIELDSVSSYANTSQLVLQITVKQPEIYLKQLYPLQRIWFEYSLKNNPPISVPAIRLKASDVDTELNQLKMLLDSYVVESNGIPK